MAKARTVLPLRGTRRQWGNAPRHDECYSGDADVDFVRGMIPHHQRAIDMAKVELEYMKDPELRKLAEGIVAAQESEIETMQTWLKAHGQSRRGLWLLSCVLAKIA